VDDIISEVHKLQSKKKNRNSNPFALPCIWNWCRDPRTPPTFPEPAPRAEIPANDGGASSSTSSSRTPTQKCDDAMEIVLEAAHNVDVGDYYFGQGNYKAALLRYKDAVEGKAEDVAIHVRLGRVLEKLEQFPEATEEYQAAQKVAGPKKWHDEATEALLRLQTPRP
jgi:tetratricopeptide (TPR) repeat protein